MVSSLDDTQAVKTVDTSDLLSTVEDLGAQCEEAADIAGTFDSSAITDVDNVLILGMGGSGISGDIIRTLLEDELDVPLSVVKGYTIPAYVGKKTLVFAISYSGDTEETLSCVEQALGKGARIVAVTSGGELKKKAGEAGFPAITIPGGHQPRAALGYLSMPILVALARAGLISDVSSSVDEAVGLLREMRSECGIGIPEINNLPKKVARELYGKVPVVYGSEGVLSAAALRWKCQFNENSKVPAFQNSFPELNHNETVGWELLDDQTRRFHLVMLRASGEHDRVQKRVDVTLPLISDHLDGVTEVWTKGKSKLAQLLSVIYLGDLASVYLAVLNGVDPTPVDRIKLLKKRLSEA